MPPLKQHTYPDCGITSLRMVLAYYGCPVTAQEVSAFAIKAADGTLPETELARFARSRGFQVDSLAYDLALTHPDDATLPREYLLRKLRQERSDPWFAPSALRLDSLIACLQAGVHYLIAPPAAQTLVSYLQHGIPLMTTVNRAALRKRQGSPEDSHTIVLTGIERSVIAFIDPTLAPGFMEQVSLSDLLFAIQATPVIARSSYLQAIRKDCEPETSPVRGDVRRGPRSAVCQSAELYLP